MNPTLINALIKICHVGEGPYVARVREILGNLRDPDVIEILCDYLILSDDPDPILLNIFREKGYGPKDESKRAMYFFITEQWKNYEKHDFQEDRPLLRQNFAIISEDLRKKVVASARKGGRTAILMKALIGHGKRHKIHEMGNDEWSSIIEYLKKNSRWNDLWKLIIVAPIEWSSEILLILGNSGWKAKQELYLFKQLLNLCPKEGKNLKLIDLQHHMTIAGPSVQLNNLMITENGRLLIGKELSDTKLCIWNLRDGTVFEEINIEHALNNPTNLYELPSELLINSIYPDDIFVIGKKSKNIFADSGILSFPEKTPIKSYSGLGFSDQ